VSDAGGNSIESEKQVIGTRIGAGTIGTGMIGPPRMTTEDGEPTVGRRNRSGGQVGDISSPLTLVSTAASRAGLINMGMDRPYILPFQPQNAPSLTIPGPQNVAAAYTRNIHGKKEMNNCLHTDFKF